MANPSAPRVTPWHPGRGRWVSCVSTPPRLLERDGVWQEALLPPVQRAPQRGRALGVRGAEGHRQQGARADAHPAAHARRRGGSAAPGWGTGGDTAGTRPGGPSAAAAVASQEHCSSPEVLEQIYRCNPILRYTSSPLYAPLLPFPYGSLDQSGERVGGRGTLGCQTVPVQGTPGCQTVPVQRGGPGAEQEWQELGWV